MRTARGAFKRGTLLRPLRRASAGRLRNSERGTFRLRISDCGFDDNEFEARSLRSLRSVGMTPFERHAARLPASSCGLRRDESP